MDTFITSDAHDSQTRYPNLGECKICVKNGKRVRRNSILKNPKKCWMEDDKVEKAYE
ncbi:MAG: hypothetical protein ACLSXO_00355 [Coprococcus sp.]